MGDGSYGFWVFNPYVTPTVSGNAVTGVTVGLGTFGTVDAATTQPLFTGNVVDCDGRAGSVGSWTSTTLFGLAPSTDVHAILQGNRITGCATGLAVEAEPSLTAALDASGNTIVDNDGAGVALVSTPWDGTYDVDLSHNRIAGNGIGLHNPTGEAVDAAANWWGCNAGPGGSGALGPCDTRLGTATVAPWLVLAPPALGSTLLALGGSTTVTADLAHDSTSAAAAPGAPNGTPVFFSTTIPSASLTPPSAATAGGTASSLLAVSVPGRGSVCTSVDNERTCASPVDAGGFHTVVPCRVLDTRIVGPELSGGVPRLVTLVGGTCGVPAAARAVAVNVTITEATSAGDLTLYPANLAVPGTTTVSFSGGQTRANNAVLLLATDASGQLGAVISGGGTAHLGGRRRLLRLRRRQPRRVGGRELAHRASLADAPALFTPTPRRPVRARRRPAVAQPSALASRGSFLACEAERSPTPIGRHEFRDEP